MSNKRVGYILTELTKVLEQRRNADTTSSYTASLYHKGTNNILKKIGEEAIEVVIAAKDGDKKQIIYEIADLWFHSLILLAEQDLSAKDILIELERRFGLSGIDEKKSRSK